MTGKEKSGREEIISWGVILLIYIAGLVIFFPKIKYPCGDSWFYCRNVYDTLVSGKITFTNAQAATPIFQIWLGVLLCKVTLGFAFWKLNLLAYAFSFLGALYTYRFIRLFTNRAPLALLGAILLIGMPPFFKTSMAFMTDPFSYFGLILAFYHGARYTGVGSRDDETVNTGGRRDAVIAAIGFVIAILNRTNALLTFLAFVIYVFIHRGELKPKLYEWIAHTIPLIAFIAFNAWLTISGAAPYYLGIFVRKMFLAKLYHVFTSSEFFNFVPDKIATLAKWAGYLGVILLPVTIWILIRSWDKWGGGKDKGIEPQAARTIWFILAPLLTIITLVLITYPAGEVILPNTVTAYGLGVKNIILPYAQPLFGSDFFTILQILIGLGGILLGLSAIGRVLGGFPAGKGRGFVWWMIISTAAFPFITFVFSDRYLIPLFPLLFVLMVEGMDAYRALPRWVWIFPIVLIAGVGLLGNEYFGWNTARWKVIGYTPVDSTDQVDTEWEGPLVDGGLEYTAFRYYNDEKFLKQYKALWQGEMDMARLRFEVPSVVPDYVLWWNLPRHYDFIVREEEIFGRMKVEFESPARLLVGEVNYIPFPLSEPRVMQLYAWVYEDDSR